MEFGHSKRIQFDFFFKLESRRYPKFFKKLGMNREEPKWSRHNTFSRRIVVFTIPKKTGSGPAVTIGYYMGFDLRYDGDDAKE